MEFLGMIVDSIEIKSPRRKDKQEAKHLLSADTLVSRTVGKMNAMAQGIPPAPLFYRELQRDLTSALEEGDQSYETPCPCQ